MEQTDIEDAYGAESEAVIAAALVQVGYTALTPTTYAYREQPGKECVWAADYEL